MWSTSSKLNPSKTPKYQLSFEVVTVTSAVKVCSVTTMSDSRASPRKRNAQDQVQEALSLKVELMVPCVAWQKNSGVQLVMRNFKSVLFLIIEDWSRTSAKSILFCDMSWIKYVSELHIERHRCEYRNRTYNPMSETCRTWNFRVTSGVLETYQLMKCDKSFRSSLSSWVVKSSRKKSRGLVSRQEDKNQVFQIYHFFFHIINRFCRKFYSDQSCLTVEVACQQKFSGSKNQRKKYPQEVLRKKF